ncbi:MAG: GNAT family N-acetyltransferase [Bacteroidales bacterium]|nr:GNAT family N-acetyltransferase [Bacteroidales bacterium]
MAETSILTHLDENAKRQIECLLTKLYPSAPQIDTDRINTLLDEGTMTLFCTRERDGEITGILTLCRCQTLTCDKYWIEDVVVEESRQGKGLGRSLIRTAVREVRERGGHTAIYLTSNPSRISARHLYRSEGFEEYATGVFRMKP